MSNNSGTGSGSHRLANLAKQLCHYNPPSSTIGTSAVTVHKENQIHGQSSVSDEPNRAAVLICIFEGDEGDLRVILTKRSATVSSHSGDVALPGGKMEEADADDVATALREAKEEIGLDPSLVDVVAVLEPFAMKHRLLVVPVIGLLANKNAFHPTLNADEVEVVFDAPLEMFLKDESRRAEEREWMGDKYLIHYFDYEVDNQKHLIYALTAGILIEAASVVYQRSPAFIERKPKFWNNKGN